MAQFQQCLEQSSLILGFFSLFYLSTSYSTQKHWKFGQKPWKENIDKRGQLPAPLCPAVSTSCNTTWSVHAIKLLSVVFIRCFADCIALSRPLSSILYSCTSILNKRRVSIYSQTWNSKFALKKWHKLPHNCSLLPHNLPWKCHIILQLFLHPTRSSAQLLHRTMCCGGLLFTSLKIS